MIFGIGGLEFSLGITGFLFWILFCLRKLLGLGYKPYVEPYKTSVSVVIPAYNEEEDILRRCLTSILENRPQEVICVFNGKPVGYEVELEASLPRVKFLHQGHADKRDAMALGVKVSHQSSEIIVFVDSDVEWERNTLKELTKPFADPKIGGAAAHQVVDNADASIWTAIGSWLIYLGLTTGIAFQSAKRCASCLRGRTAAYRRRLLMRPKFLTQFTQEIFLGIRCKSGDDGRLTFLALKYGYGTFVQSSAVAHTILPESMDGFLKHRLRCNRNTFRRYFGSMFSGWFWRQNWRFLIEWFASVIIPLGFISCVYSFLAAVVRGDWAYLGLVFAWFWIGRSLRGAGWIKERPVRFFRIPLMVFAFMGPLLLVRWYAFFTMNRQGWVTRANRDNRWWPMWKPAILLASTGMIVVFTTLITTVVYLRYMDHSHVMAKGDQEINSHPSPALATRMAVVVTPMLSTPTPEEPINIERLFFERFVSRIISTPAVTLTATEVSTPVRLVSTPVFVSTPISTPAPTPQPTQPSIGERLLVGIYLPDFPPRENLTRFEEQVQGRMDLISWYQHWSHDPVSNKLKHVCGEGRIPIITWESWNGRGKDGGNPYPLPEIAHGEHNQFIEAYLQAMGQACKEGEIWIRFDHEMNTSPGRVYWYPWQGDPEAYVSAWRQVIDIGHEVAPNIKWIWAPAWGNEDAFLYYPGDGYVDFIGLTINQYWRSKLDLRLEKWVWRSWGEMYEANRQVVLTFGKPIVVAEAATGEGPGSDSKANWIREFLASRANYPEIVGVVWFNAQRAREFEDIEFPLTSSPQALEAFSEGIRALRE